MMRVGVVGNRRYEALDDILGALQARASALGIEYCFEEELVEGRDDDACLAPNVEIDALLTLGGDGTMLRAARLMDGRQIPILGINLGRLGFLTTCGRDELEASIERLAAREFRVERRMTLQATTTRGLPMKPFRALNDVVLHKGGFARVTRMHVSINGELVAVYGADGIIVSSPTGSTAYSLSAGGPVVVPTMESIIVTPISAHTLAIRPLVVPADAVVTVHAEDGPDELLVTVDGQVGSTFAPGDTLEVSRAAHPVLLVRFEMTFFMRMRRKLGWGGLAERDETGGGSGERC